MAEGLREELIWHFADSSGLFVITSARSGMMTYSAVGDDTEPAPPDGEWDINADAEIVALDGVVQVFGWGWETDGVNLATSGPGTYRARIWGRNRGLEAGEDLYDGAAAESYCIAIWPAS